MSNAFVGLIDRLDKAEARVAELETLNDTCIKEIGEQARNNKQLQAQVSDLKKELEIEKGRVASLIEDAINGYE